MTNTYQGPERRSHRVLITENTEYHLRGNTCVGVRDKKGTWQSDHDALGSALVGSINFTSNTGYQVSRNSHPATGHRLCFGELLTSPLKNIIRPKKSDIEQYEFLS